MKRFSEIREKTVSKNVVFDKKIQRIPVKIINTGKDFDLYIDGDKLDSYKTQADAEKNAKLFIKELGK